MKTVASLADLKDHALRTGSSVELGGSRFNMEGTRVTNPSSRLHGNVSTAYQSAPPVPASPVQDLVLALVAKQLTDQQVDSSGRDAARVGAAIAQAIADAMAKVPAPQVTVQAPAGHKYAEPPRAWKFTFDRDAEGRISSITATAK